jgi:hypothetical protein
MKLIGGGMCARSSSHVAVWLLWIVICCAACATHQDVNREPAGPALHVHLGPIIPLMPAQKWDYEAQAVIDIQGQVHVLAASFKPSQAEEIVVSADGVLKRRVVAPIKQLIGWGPHHLDEEFDEQGRLHAVVNGRHFVFADEGWVLSGHTPWEETGTKAEDVSFVHGAPGLIWKFQGSGSELGAKAHWEVWGFGNAMGGLIWPWRTHGTRTVIVPEIDSAYPVWTVVEPNDKHNTLVKAAAADGKSNVCLIYSKDVGGLFSNEIQAGVPQSIAALGGLWYGCIPGLGARAAGASSDVPSTGASRTLKNRIQLRPFEGAAFPTTAGIAPISVAVGPQTGTVLAGTQWLLQDSHWQGPLPGSSVIAGSAHVIAAGNNGFHAVGIAHDAYDNGWGNRYPAILYSRLSPERGWSQPVEVGTAYVQTNAYWTQHSTNIAATADGRVFIVWPAAEGLVGRWVTEEQ